MRLRLKSSERREKKLTLSSLPSPKKDSSPPRASPLCACSVLEMAPAKGKRMCSSHPAGERLARASQEPWTRRETREREGERQSSAVWSSTSSSIVLFPSLSFSTLSFSVACRVLYVAFNEAAEPRRVEAQSHGEQQEQEQREENRHCF